jgi:ABC-type thiamine transport system substrate-binding protein
VVYYSGQCPYHAMFVTSLLNAANALGIPAHSVELKSSWEARSLSPSAYGVFGVVYNGQLLSYRPMGGNTLREILEKSDEKLLP